MNKPRYTPDMCNAAGAFAVGSHGMSLIGGRMSRRILRNELEANGMTRKQADEYLTAAGFPKQQPVRRAK